MTSSTNLVLVRQLLEQLSVLLCEPSSCAMDRRQSAYLNFEDVVRRQKQGGPGLLVGHSAKTGLPYFLKDEVLRRHILVSGNIGVSTFLANLLASQIARGGGFFYLSPSHDEDTFEHLNFCMTAAKREAQFKVLAPMQQKCTNRYTPLRSGDLSELVARLLLAFPRDNAPGYDLRCSQLADVLAVLLAGFRAKNEEPSFQQLAQLLTNMRELETFIGGIPTHSCVRSSLNVLLNHLNGKARSSELIDAESLKKVLEKFAGRMVMLRSFESNNSTGLPGANLNLSEALLQKQGVYFALPILGKDFTNLTLGQMALDDLRVALEGISTQKAVEEGPPFVLVMESSLYAVDATRWAMLTEVATAANVCLVLVEKGLKSLSEHDPEFLDEIYNCTDTHFMFPIETTCYRDRLQSQMVGEVSDSGLPFLVHTFSAGEFFLFSGKHFEVVRLSQ